MKVFAIISLVLAAISFIIYAPFIVKGWFDRNKQDFAGGCILTVMTVCWILTALCLTIIS